MRGRCPGYPPVAETTGRRRERVPAQWFDEVYAADPDPWHFATSAYEARKFDLTVACLPRPRYRRAFEPGCSFGELTARLATRCDELLAVDVAASVVERARDRFASDPRVTVEQRSLPEQWPSCSFDLVVLSEVAYYLTSAQLDDLLHRAAVSLETGGDLVAVHWTGPTSYPLPGGDIARRIDATDAFDRRVTHVEPEFELGVWRRH